MMLSMRNRRCPVSAPAGTVPRPCCRVTREPGGWRLTAARFVLMTCGLLLVSSPARAAVAGKAEGEQFPVVRNGQPACSVVVAANAGKIEQQAAAELVRCVRVISGAELPLVSDPAAVRTALTGARPVIVVGQQALLALPELKQQLARATKPNPVLRADAIVAVRRGNRVYLAGNSDEAHYYAVAELLHRWGCRWYMPGEMGECLPVDRNLAVGQLDYSYGSPFEVRRYWVSWLGETAGREEFMLRNRMNNLLVPNGHILAKYTKDLAPKGKTHWNVPITEDRTAEHVARQVAPLFAAGKDVQLGMEDGLYDSDSPRDQELIGLQYDKYFMVQSVTDAFLVFYNKVARRLQAAHPNSRARIGFLAYANMTLPPVRDITAEKPLVAYLAPIDIDPIHHMEHPRSAPRRELKDMLYRWAKVMEGRVVIYDYDQGMLVWRDVPAPSVQMFRHDVRHFQKAGILGVDTESRGAFATTMTNLFFRAQLLWNPDADVDALQAEFYQKFYGPAAAPMQKYWEAIQTAWDETIVTEHEHFVIPAIYTPALLEELQGHLQQARKLVAPLAGSPATGRNALYMKRMEMTRLGFEVLQSYTAMARAAAGEADFAAAVRYGKAGLAAREKLTDLDGILTTYRRIGERGPAWWPGEVEQYAKLAELVDGTRGSLVQKLPLEWSFRRDLRQQGEQDGWFRTAPDLSWWNSQDNPASVESRQQNPGEWERVRADLYLQAQGLVTPEFQSWTGHGWYHTSMELTAAQVSGPVHLMFPGLFNRCRLYLNGEQVAERKQQPIWWRNDYRFEWDVDLTGKLRAGENRIVLAIENPHHFGGMFRRPFLYRAAKK